MIYSYVHYCNIIWSGTYQAHVEPLTVLQKRAIRIITGQSYLAHTNNLFLQENMLKFTDVNIYLTAIFMFKNLNKFKTFSSHNYNTRGKLLLRPEFQRISLTQQNISYRGPKIWNSLPEPIRNSRSLQIFKSNMRNYLTSKYQ